MQLFSNFAQTYMVSALGGLVTDVSFTVATTDGGLFAAPQTPDFEHVTLTDGTYWEVVKLTSRVGDVFTVERAYEGVIRAWPEGTIVKHTVTKDMLERFIQREQMEAAFHVFSYKHFT